MKYFNLGRLNFMLRQLICILLTGILLFNFTGYRLLIDLFIASQHHTMNRTIDREDFIETSLISFKMPMQMPYYTNDARFERAYGEVDVDGVKYHYVKRRVFNDSLEVLCIPDAVSTRLQQQKQRYLQQDAHLPANPRAGDNATVKVNLPEFYQFLKFFDFSITAYQAGNFFSQASSSLPTGFYIFPDRPPQSGYSFNM